MKAVEPIIFVLFFIFISLTMYALGHEHGGKKEAERSKTFAECVVTFSDLQKCGKLSGIKVKQASNKSVLINNTEDVRNEENDN